jgi:hypothetical protein
MRRLWILFIALLLVIPAGASARKAKAAEVKKDKQTDVAKRGKLDINTASQSELEAVNGIGPVTARKVIDNRPYRSINDLEKAGLSKSKIDDLRSSLKASRASARDESNAVDKPESDAGVATSSRSEQPRSDQAASKTNDDTKKPSLWDRLRGKKSEDSASQQASTTRGETQKSPAVENAPTPGGGEGKVWVNTETKVYHLEGDQWYGKTKHGEYMTEREAIARGYRPVKERKKQ